MLLAQAEAGDHHRIALGEARVGGLRHHAGHVDATHHGEATHDLALAGGRQGVLVVHVGPAGAQHHVALVQVAETDGVDARDGLAVLLMHAKGAERIHDVSSSSK